MWNELEYTYTDQCVICSTWVKKARKDIQVPISRVYLEVEEMSEECLSLEKEVGSGPQREAFYFYAFNPQ